MPPTEAETRRRRILAAIHDVPTGRTASYGQIARRAGFPRCARLVARILSDAGEALPWHRIVRADGRIAFPPGSAAFDEQVARLRGEGVAVANGRVRPTDDAETWLDRVLWG
ncbi:MGMT family protein [Denitratimonas tolerans]|uniref:MGMT family protein n=1 Tax=Denitratimonas tolerans TaxID=1338420 RepID=A0AAW9R8H0_9GAMM